MPFSACLLPCLYSALLQVPGNGIITNIHITGEGQVLPWLRGGQDASAGPQGVAADGGMPAACQGLPIEVFAHRTNV